jgi:cell surface protein SprA
LRSSVIKIYFSIAGLIFFLFPLESSISSVYLAQDFNVVSPSLEGMHLYNSFLSTIAFINSPLWMFIGFQNTVLQQPQTQSQDDTSYFRRPEILKPPDVLRLQTSDQYLRYRKSPKDYKKIIKIDSLTGKIISYDLVDKEIINHPYEMDIDDWLALRKKMVVKSLLDTITYKYDLKTALSGGDLARMLSASTGLTIPIPPNPLSSLFGKPEININVNGEVNVKAGWRWDSQNLGTVSAFGQTQSSPIFSQDIKVNVSARIGDKFKMNTDWNTRRQFDYENKFKVGFEGEDDDIVKLLEVGNVSMPLPTTLITGGQALFGVRGDFQFGKLFLKTIASQSRGERKNLGIKGGTNKTPFTIRAYDFAKNHFFLDTAYKSIYNLYFKSSTPVIPSTASYYRIKEIEVWESTGITGDIPNTSQVIAVADVVPVQLKNGQKYPDSVRRKPITPGICEHGSFLRLDSTRYQIDYNLGTLTIQNLRPDHTYAVGFRAEGATESNIDDIYYGNLSTLSAQKDTLLLRLVYSPNLQPGFKTLWSRQMKNVYPINATNVNVADTRITVSYINQNNDSTDVLQGAPDKLVTIMRVDQVNNSTGAPPPDGIFDLRPPFFDQQHGEITFPSVEPFRQGIRDYFKKIGSPQIAEQYVFNEIYDTTYDVARRNTARDRFVISGEVSGTQTNRISLNAFNLAQGSVKVTLDGVPLREYEDFIVDYYSGQLTLRNPRAMLPNANLQISFEQNDIFNLTTRTLVGLRADYQLFKTRLVNANIGFTSMLYDQSAVIDRVRLGEEPVQNTMFGFDGRLNWDTPWLTRLLDYLPFYSTKAPSSISARGEWALDVPNPNKRTSTVFSDNNEPVVYIDDFEGAQRYMSLSLSPYQWQHSSQPEDSSISNSSPPNDSTAATFRGRMFWYQYFLPRVRIAEVYPQRSTIQGRSNLSPLYLSFDPNIRGIYNKNPQFLDRANPKFDSTNVFSYKPENRNRIWGGMERLLSSFNYNFDTENIEYIEIMMKVDFQEAGTQMYIDLGQISEDIIPNQKLDTEDGWTKASPVPNGIIDQGEDVGIDTLSDALEKEQYPAPLNLESDPARDDYRFDFGKDDVQREAADFANYNNFEGNASVSEMGQFPDQEILNKNNGQAISLANSYFSYQINLNPDPVTNTQIIGKNNGWCLYRIPIRKPTIRVGNPLFSNVQYVRVWFKGGGINVGIADWRLVGSNWQRISDIQSNVSPNDSIMQVGFINVEENSNAPDYYAMPPGVQAPTQLNNPDPNQIVKLNEQSLLLQVKNLRYSDERLASRYFRPLDIFNYKVLKFFIHGDGSMPDAVVKGAVPKAYAFLRFGIDSVNYYEYRRPLTRGWQGVEIPLTQLTAIKQIRTGDSSQRQSFPVPGDPLAIYSIRGSPILTKVQFFAFGIANPPERYPNELTTTMWVDELRLLSPERSADWAGVANIEMKLADLGTVNASISNKQPNFHGLEERFGDRITSTNWVVTMQGNLEKFAPKAFTETKIPITYTHAEFMENPQFVANSDVNLLQAANAAAQKAREDALSTGASVAEADRLAQAANDATTVRSQTLKVQDSWALTGVKLGIPTNLWLIKDTFNKLTFGYSYAQEYQRTPVVEEHFSWIWTFTTQYAVQIPELIAFKPLGWTAGIPLLNTFSDAKYNILPVSFSSNINFTRRRTTEQSRFLDFPSPVFRDFSAMRQAQASWKLGENGFLNPTIDYNTTISSTLVPFELDENGIQRTGSQLASQILFNKGLINFGENSLHSQSVTINIKPKLPVGAYVKYFDITGAFTTNFNWVNPLQPDPAIRDIAKNTSFQNTIRLNTSIKLKSMADQWFGIPPANKVMNNPVKDTSEHNLFQTIGLIFKFILLDYEKFDINFNQSNNSTNPGVIGGEGMSNFWGRGLLFRQSENTFGPSFAYQMGLVTDPHGGFYAVSKNSFPYFGFATTTGLRPANAVLQDNFSQKTTLDMKTSRPLWPGATLELTWKTELGYNKNQTVITDSNGVPRFTNVIALQSFNKTFLSFPSFFGLNVFNNTIEHVISLYEARKSGIAASKNDTVTKNQMLQKALSESFHDGLQAISFIGGTVGKFLPSLNWAIRWEGIEKWAIWNGLVKKVNFEHAYTSKYMETAQTTDNGTAIQNQQVQFGFQPLLGVTMTFDDKKLNGVLTASLRWNSTNAFQLTSANRSTVERQSTTEIQGQSAYTMKGFEFPIFGISLKNDLEFSFMASFKKNQRATYDVSASVNDYGGTNGRTLDGNTQIIIEPRVRYSMSDRISAAYFFHYEGTFTEGAASPGYNTYQTGLEIRLSIAGGR